MLLAELEAMKKQKEAAEASLAKATADAMHQHDPNAIQPIIRPKGEVGDKKCGFELRTTMKLEGKEHKELFLMIQVSIYLCYIVAIDFFTHIRT